MIGGADLLDLYSVNTVDSLLSGISSTESTLF